MKLKDAASVVRSKNSGIRKVTIDILFEDERNYERVKEEEMLTSALFADIYNLPVDEVEFYTYDPGLGFKITLDRKRPVGNPGDSDVFGAQQYAPILDIELYLEDED